MNLVLAACSFQGRKLSQTYRSLPALGSIQSSKTSAKSLALILAKNIASNVIQQLVTTQY